MLSFMTISSAFLKMRSDLKCMVRENIGLEFSQPV